MALLLKMKKYEFLKQFSELDEETRQTSPLVKEPAEDVSKYLVVFLIPSVFTFQTVCLFA